MRAPQVPLPAVALTWLAPPVTSPDAPALEVAAAVLASGESSRLNQSLVYRQQIATQAGFNADLRVGPGLLTAFAIAAGGKSVADVGAALLAEVTRLATAPPSAAELAKIKTQLVTEALVSRQTPLGLASAIGDAAVLEGERRARQHRPRGPAARHVRGRAARHAPLCRRQPQGDDRLSPGGRAMTPVRTPSLARLARYASIAALALFAATGFAQPYTTPPPPAPPRPLTIDAPSEARLANHLRVIVARREGVPLVSAELVALAGAETDPPRLSGLASLSAALMTQGTERHSAPELAAAAEALGGSLDSGAGWNSATVAITVTTPKLDAALALVAEVAREPVFAPEEIERLRTQTLDQLKVAYARPGTLAALVAERLAYGLGPYGHPATGTPESLPRIRRDDLVAVHRRTFRPDNAVLILTGDITADAGLALARKHFGSWVAPGRAAADDASTRPARPRARPPRSSTWRSPARRASSSRCRCPTARAGSARSAQC